MQLRTRTTKIRHSLRSMYPDVQTALHYRNTFELLIATILSAQCTDKQVNRVTENLFKKLKNPADFTKVSLAALEDLIRSTGFFHNKAKSIKKCSLALVEKFNGQVPNNLRDLVKLPGVGRKTANVVLGAAFGVPAIVVDTHVGRIVQRLGLTAHKDPVKIEFDLMEIVPKRAWSNFSLQLIYFGREICRARMPACPQCPVRRLCLFAAKTL